MPPPGPVVVRAGANSTPQDPRLGYRYCLAGGPLAWLATAAQDERTSTPARPEIVLSADMPGGKAQRWTFSRWLLGTAASDPVFTLTPEQYSPVLTSNRVTWFDYDGDGGTTIRFGDGTFGMPPPRRHGLHRGLPGRRRHHRQRPGGRDRDRRAG